MRPFDEILVPLGGSPFAERAVVVAIELARRTGAPLRLLSVAVPGAEAKLVARLSDLAARCGGDIEVETQVMPYGSIGRAITSAATPGSLVCMSTHGGPGAARTLLGGVTEEVLRTAAEPVLLVGPHVPPSVALGNGRIVACLDGSAFSERTLAPARRWSHALGLPLWLVQVVPSDAPPEPTPSLAVPPERRLGALVADIGDVEGSSVIHDRHPVRALAVLAESTPVAAFVMATHGRSGWSRAVVGSLVASAAHRVRVPVLVVPAVPAGRRL